MIKDEFDQLLLSVGVTGGELEDCYVWAFGEDYGVRLVTETPEMWNEKHPDLFNVDGLDDMGETIRRIGRCYLDHNSNETPGKKYDQGKSMMHLLPLDVLKDVADVLTFGAEKYGEGDWKEFVMKDPNNFKRYFSACLRHMTAFQSNEEKDEETGLHHLAHAICCLIFVYWYVSRGRGIEQGDTGF